MAGMNVNPQTAQLLKAYSGWSAGWDNAKQAQNSSASDLVSQVLRANPSWTPSTSSAGVSPVGGAQSHDLSLLQRVMSVLSAPLSGVTAGLSHVVQTGDNGLGGIEAGLKGIGANVAQAFGDTSAQTQADTGNVHKLAQDIADAHSAGDRTGKGMFGIGAGDVQKGEGTLPTIKTTTGKEMAPSEHWWQTLFNSLPPGQIMQAAQNSDSSNFLSNLAGAAEGSAEFGGSVALDPLTYLTGGVGGALKGALARGGARAVEDVAPELGAAGNARPHGGSNRLAIGASPEGIANDGSGQLLLPGTRVPTEVPAGRLSQPGAEIPQGDYQLAGQLNFPGMTGRQTRPKPANQQGTLFDSTDMRVAPEKPPVAGPGMPVVNDQSALFNFNPNPKVQGVVPNIHAYPPKNLVGDRPPLDGPSTPPVAPIAESAPLPHSAPVEAPAPAAAAPVAPPGPAAGIRPVGDAALPALQKIDSTIKSASDPMVLENKLNPNEVINLSAGVVWNALHKGLDHIGTHATKDLRITTRDGSISWKEAVKIANTEKNKIVSANVKAGKAATPVAKLTDQAVAEAAKPSTISPEVRAIMDRANNGKKGAPTPEPVATPSGGIETPAQVANHLATGDPTTAARVLTHEPPRPISAKAAEKIAAEIDAYLAREVPKGGHVSGGTSTVRSTKVPFSMNPTKQFEFLSNLLGTKGPHRAVRVNSAEAIKNGASRLNSEAGIAADFRNAFNTLKHVEQTFIDKGVTLFSYGNGKQRFPLQLSDIVTALGKDLNMAPDAVLEQMFTDANFAKRTIDIIRPKAGMTNATVVKQLQAVKDHSMPNTIQLFNDAKASKIVQTTAEYKTIEPEVTQALDTISHDFGGTPVAQAYAADHIADVVPAGTDQAVIDTFKNNIKETNAPVTETQHAVSASAKANVDALVTGEHNVAGGVKAADAAIHDANVAKTIEMATAPESSIMGAFLNHVSAAWGVKLLHPVWRSDLNAVNQVMNDFTASFNNLLGGYTHDQLLAAVKQINGTLTPGADEAVNAAAAAIRQRYSALYGMPEFQKYVQGNTVISRTGIPRDTLNAAMTRAGMKGEVFSNRVVESKAGVHTDFSKGTDWLNSGLIYLENSANIMEDLRKMEAATGEAVGRQMLMNHIGSMFGSLKPTGEKVAHLGNSVPELKGVYFHPDMAKEVQNLMKKMDEVAWNPNEFIRQTDTITRLFKTSATIYNLSHHINNLVGDSFMAYLAGAKLTPTIMNKAWKAMYSQKGYYGKGLQPEVATSHLAMLLGDSSAASDILIKSATGTSVISKVKIRGKEIPVSGDQYARMMREQGLLPKYNAVEDLNLRNAKGEAGQLSGLDKYSPFRGKVAAGVHHGSEVREHSIRYAHFISMFEQNIKQIQRMNPKWTADQVMNAAADGAGSSVRKYHPDGLDMTKFEKDFARRVIPFYSWTRKAIPLMVMGIVQRPARMMLPSKLNYALQNATGVNPQSMQYPFPTDQAFPNWIVGQGIGPQTGYDPGNMFGSNPGGGYLMSAMGGLPFTGLGAQYGNNPLSGLGAALNPMLRVPAEILSDHTMQTGQQIRGGTSPIGIGRYAQNQIPTLATPSRLTGIGQNADQNNMLAILNWLTGAGTIDASKPNYIKQANIQNQQDRTVARKAAQNGG